jgi:hypothetical protein
MYITGMSKQSQIEKTLVAQASLPVPTRVWRNPDTIGMMKDISMGCGCVPSLTGEAGKGNICHLGFKQS